METRSIVTPDMPGSVHGRKSNFLDYYKTILGKVSFDYQLFNKEYRKAISTLSPEERVALNRWIQSTQLNSTPIFSSTG